MARSVKLLREFPVGADQHATIDVSASSHSHVFCIESGFVEAEFADRHYRALKGEWLILEPRSRTIGIAFDATWPNGESWISESAVFHGADYSHLQKCAQSLIRSKRIVSPVHWDIRDETLSQKHFFTLQGQLQMFLAELSEVFTREAIATTLRRDCDPRVTQAKLCIESLIPRGVFQREDIAAQVGSGIDVGISVVHLERIFYAVVGSTMAGYYRICVENMPVRNLFAKEFALKNCPMN